MPTIKLTRRLVENAKPQARRYTLFDTETRGFGLRVSPGGGRTWIVEYRPSGGGRGVDKRRLTLGKPESMSLEKARRTAKERLATIRLGADPASDLAEARKAATVAELADDFLKEHVEPKRSAQTFIFYRDILNRLVIPQIGKIKAQAVRRSDLSKLHAGLKETPVMANRVLAVIGSMYAFAEKHGHVPEGHISPARGIELYREEGRDRHLSSDELARLGAALREAETAGIPWSVDETRPTVKHAPKPKNRRTFHDPAAIAAVRLLLFTGCRVSEILTLEWAFVEFEQGVLRLPKSKTGRKTVVLNAPALDILANLPRHGRYVIPGASAGRAEEKPRTSLKRPWRAIAGRAGIEDVRLHDLRHQFASTGAGAGINLPMVGKLLGHAELRSTQRYSHYAADPLRKASGTIAAALSEAMGEAVARPAEVVNIDERLRR